MYSILFHFFEVFGGVILYLFILQIIIVIRALLDAFADIFQFLQKFVPTAPGSMSITFIPNGSSSYCIDSDRPSKANLVA
jgi:hypothetical protein